MTTNTLNLDQKAAQYAQKIVKSGIESKDAKTVENLVTKTLGVLQEQGVYAMMLFLFSRTSDEAKIAPAIRSHLYSCLKELPGFNDASIEDDAEKALNYYSDSVLKNLDTLLLVRDLYEQTLIYARFGAKAGGK